MNSTTHWRNQEVVERTSVDPSLSAGVSFDGLRETEVPPHGGVPLHTSRTGQSPMMTKQGVKDVRPSQRTKASYSFTLDGAGNRTNTLQTEPDQTLPSMGSSVSTYNLQKNRLLSSGGGSFTYDDEGQIATGYGSTYTFDYEHRLTAIGSSSSFSYDGRGNRLEAIRDSVTTRYMYDVQGNLMAEADGDNEITRYYIHGAGLLAMVTPSNQVYSYHFNGTGSTIAMTDAAQAVINQYRYDPFGNIINQSETVSNPFTFVGQYGVMTEPNGFYYMRARYYDPQVGRFISEDPIGFDGGDVNLYGYAGNNPVNRVDPKGLFNILFGGGASVTAPTGFDISGGIVVNPGLFGQKADVGVLGSAGVAGGINVSADAFIGIVRGGIENVRGLTSNFNLTIGPLSLTVFVDPKTGTIMGGTVGIGPAATPAGVSVSFPYTGHITARDIFSPTSTSAQSRGYSK